MIYEMSRDLGERLAARKYPYAVVYAPERADRKLPAIAGPTITVERDRRGGDGLETAHGFGRNPRKHGTRLLGVEVRIFAKSSLRGAHIGDHERECEAVVDAFLTELQKWAREVARLPGMLVPTESRYLAANELDGLERWAGVAYMIRFRIPRGLNERDYEGAAQPTAGVSGTSNTTHVRYKGQESSAPEIGCSD